MDVWCFLERKTEMRMIRWMCGVSLKERQPSTELQTLVSVEAIVDVMRRCSRLRWHRHVQRNGDADCVKACAKLVLTVICSKQPILELTL